MRFPRKEYWNGLPFPPPGDLPNPGSNWHLLQVIHIEVISKVDKLVEDFSGGG